MPGSSKHILFIANPVNIHTDNPERLRRGFSKAGWRTSQATHQSIWVSENELLVDTDVEPSMTFSSFDLIWMIGFGSRSTFLDRMQLLSTQNQAPFVNSIQACLHLQNKAMYSTLGLDDSLPQHYCGEDSEKLAEVVQSGGSWVAKPTAGSFGRDVYFLDANDPNLMTILDRMTSDGYVLLQKVVPTTEERRWMLVNGQVLGCYGKQKSERRGNLGAGSTPVIVETRTEETEFAQSLAQTLAKSGVRACAVDIAYPYLLDINFINPGWFQTMENLTGEDLSLKVPDLF